MTVAELFVVGLFIIMAVATFLIARSSHTRETGR
jgi:hypothetical protein